MTSISRSYLSSTVGVALFLTAVWVAKHYVDTPEGLDVFCAGAFVGIVVTRIQNILEA